MKFRNRYGHASDIFVNCGRSWTVDQISLVCVYELGDNAQKLIDIGAFRDILSSILT